MVRCYTKPLEYINNFFKPGQGDCLRIFTRTLHVYGVSVYYAITKNQNYKRDGREETISRVMIIPMYP